MMYASPCKRGPTSCPIFHSLTQILIFKYSQSEENMYDCLLLDVIRLPSLNLQKLSNIPITFHFLENFLQCYMYLQQIRFKTKLLIITPLFQKTHLNIMKNKNKNKAPPPNYKDYEICAVTKLRAYFYLRLLVMKNSEGWWRLHIHVWTLF